jgi:hypothetical protein
MEYSPYVSLTNETSLNTNNLLYDIIQPQMISQNETISSVVTIKKELLQSIQQEDFNESLYSEEEDIKKHKEFLQETNETLKKGMDAFAKEQDKLLDLEMKYKESIKKTSSDIEVIETFINFIATTNSKYPNVNFKEIETNIKDVCQEIKEKNESIQLKQDYMKQLFITTLYTQKLIKHANLMNVGYTCSLCLQAPVTTYINPCGHTGCEDCIKKLQSYGSGNYNCHICRKEVTSFQKVYFS